MNVNYKHKLAFFCWGTFGVGKSFVIRETAKEIAKEKGREFKEWNKLTRDEKLEVYNNPSKYFVLCDLRLSEFDSSDIKGIPSWKNGEMDFIEWKSPFFAKLLAKEESDGILFFDEISLATPLVISSCYKIIYDRIINDEKVSDDWLIIGAGNLDSDNAFTHTLPSPLKDRGSEVELKIPTAEDWVTDFAIPNNFDSRIIGFVSFKPSNLHKVDYKDNQKFVTPRGWQRLNTLIKDVKGYPALQLICQSAIGEGIATEFVSFCKIQEKLNLEDLIKNPKKIKNITEVSVKYFLVSALAERYADKKRKEVDFEKIMETSEVLDENKSAEFVALMWRLASSYTEKSKLFKKDFLADTKYDKFKEKYGKFIVS